MIRKNICGTDVQYCSQSQEIDKLLPSQQELQIRPLLVAHVYKPIERHQSPLFSHHIL